MNSAINSTQAPYLAEFQRVAQDLPGAQLQWLQAIKQDALNEFAEKGLPTTRNEDWKYTNVTPLTRQTFKCDPQQPKSESAQIDLADLLPLETITTCMVFIDGIFAADLSKLQNLPAGLSLSSLAQALERDDPLLKKHLNKVTSLTSHAFKPLNTLFIQDGALIYLAPEIQITQPIYLLFISTEQQAPQMNTLRNLIIADEYSQLKVIEHYICLNQSVYFTNTLTEIYLQPHAELKHYKVQQESAKAFHIGLLELQQQSHSHFTSHSFALGGALVRSDIDVELVAEHTFCALNGLYLARDKQHIDHHTSINHHKPHGISREYYKGVLTEHARAVFNGKIVVAPGAYKTDAQQTNKNLLLSSAAEIDTKPQLEIYADDVQCAHGAAIGQLDVDAVFFLRARGLSDEQARSLLVYAFVQELFSRVTEPALQNTLQNILNDFLPAEVALEELA